MTHGGGLTFSQNLSSPALTVWDRQCLEDSERKDHLMNESVSDEGVCRTAPATLGLLITRLGVLYRKKWCNNFSNTGIVKCTRPHTLPNTTLYYFT